MIPKKKKITVKEEYNYPFLRFYSKLLSKGNEVREMTRWLRQARRFTTVESQLTPVEKKTTFLKIPCEREVLIAWSFWINTFVMDIVWYIGGGEYLSCQSIQVTCTSMGNSRHSLQESMTQFMLDPSTQRASVQGQARSELLFSLFLKLPWKGVCPFFSPRGSREWGYTFPEKGIVGEL